MAEDLDPDWQLSEDGLTYTRTIRMYVEPSEYEICQMYRYYIGARVSQVIWDEAEQYTMWSE